MSPTSFMEEPLAPPAQKTHLRFETNNRIVRIAQQRLRSSNYKEVRSLSCEVQDGRLLLRGQVSTYYLKQLAQECLRSIKGIPEIVNNVVVIWAT